VLEMLEELKNVSEIAIDLEHHDYRTYTGLLSLMQISTREKDWIVDTLVPWRHKLEILNEVFADPKIVKVSKICQVPPMLFFAHTARSSTAPRWTSFGFREIWASTWSGSLIPTMRLMSLEATLPSRWRLC
jgi:hypothetical protein